MDLYFGILVISILFGVLGMVVSGRLKRKFAYYSQIAIRSGMTGAQIAQKMLDDHGIHDVTIESVQGKLTDHYNPSNKTVNLSPEVYQGRSVAAAAVAAHEVGHAVQHAQSYAWLQMRSTLVPFVQFSSNMMQYVMMAAMFGLFSASAFGSTGILIAAGLQGMIMLFALVTLPVEFDASRRALVWITESGVAGHRDEEYAGAKDALWWAGMTYMVAALAAVAQFLYLVLLFLNRR